MNRIALAAVAVIAAAGSALVTARQPAAQQPTAPAGRAGGRGESVPAAPPAGSPALYKSDAELTAALKEAAARAQPGAQISAPVSTTDQYRINVVRRTQGATPLTHAGNTELHHIIEGAATVVTGGKVVRGAPGTPVTVEGGVTRRVTKGDVILVPAETVHWYKEVEGSVTYLEVRFVVPTK